MTIKPKRTRRRKKKPLIAAVSTLPNKPIVSGEPHRVGYARVSMSDQSNQRQIDELVKHGVQDVDIFVDKASGKNMLRPGWDACFRELFEGDELVVWSLDRLGRNLGEVVALEKALTEKGVTLKVLSMDINTKTAAGRLIFHILLTVAQFEREWSLERTMHGLQKARERGRKGGAVEKYSEDQVRAAVMGAGGPDRIGAWAAAAKQIGCSKMTIMRRWKAMEKRSKPNEQ